MKEKSAFTLIELSIVLVIIGLIVGGVLVGQDLIAAARLRSVVSDVEKYQTAALTFKIKYNCLPGDCKNATTFFGTYNGAGSCYPIAYSTTAATEANQTTCNGNGDRMIWYAKPGDAFYYSWEKNRFWQHLSAAGLVAGQYSGIANMDGGQSSEIWASDKIGWNIPASKWPNTGYTVTHFSVASAAYFPATTNSKNKFVLGAETRCLSFTPCAWDIFAGINHIGPVFGGLEAYQIDSKIDDGAPGTGIVTGLPYSHNGFGLYCSTTDDPATAVYRTADVGGYSANIPICPLIIDAGF